jgi:hypothetical protein
MRYVRKEQHLFDSTAPHVPTRRPCRTFEPHGVLLLQHTFNVATSTCGIKKLYISLSDYTPEHG